MLNRRVLEGREGDPVLPWWREVWRWASSLPVVLGPGISMTQVPGLGTEIKVRTAAPVRVPYEVALTWPRVSVRVGMLAGRVPWLRDRRGEWCRLDGSMLDGTMAPRLPELDLSGAQPGPDGRSCIALVARVDERGDLLDDAAEPMALRIEHRSVFDGWAKRLAEEASEPYHELAILYWRDGRPVRVVQIVQHHLELAVGPVGGDVSRGLRFFFVPAG